MLAIASLHRTAGAAALRALVLSRCPAAAAASATCPSMLLSLSPLSSFQQQHQQRRGYHENIIEHYENPRNVGSLDKNDEDVGTLSSPPSMQFFVGDFYQWAFGVQGGYLLRFMYLSCAFVPSLLTNHFSTLSFRDLWVHQPAVM
ncbi:hypothetical protein ACHAXH_002212 [Discostella pseudostelligera]